MTHDPCTRQILPMEEVLLFWSFELLRNSLTGKSSVHNLYCWTGRRFTQDLIAAVLDKGKATPVVQSVVPSRSCLWAPLSQGAAWFLLQPRGVCSTRQPADHAGTVLHLLRYLQLAVRCTLAVTWTMTLRCVQWLLGQNYCGNCFGFLPLWTSTFPCSESRVSWNEYEAPSCTEQEDIGRAVYSGEKKIK